MGKNLGKIIFLNAVGLTIFFSWYLPAEHGFWFTLDKSIFYYLMNSFNLKALLRILSV